MHACTSARENASAGSMHVDTAPSAYPVTPLHAQVAGACRNELPPVVPRPPDEIAAKLAASATAFSRKKLASTSVRQKVRPTSAEKPSMPNSASYNRMADLEVESFSELQERTLRMLEKVNVPKLEGTIEAKAHAAKREEAKAARASHRASSLEAWQADRERRVHAGGAGVRWQSAREARLSEVEREALETEVEEMARVRSRRREEEENERQRRSPTGWDGDVGRCDDVEEEWGDEDGDAAEGDEVGEEVGEADGEVEIGDDVETKPRRDRERATNAASCGSEKGDDDDESDDDDECRRSEAMSGLTGFETLLSDVGGACGAESETQTPPPLRMHAKVSDSGIVWDFIDAEQITWRPPTVELLHARELAGGG